jgi:queuosine precursor transporter
MDNLIIIPLIQLLQSLPAEYTSLILFGACIVCMLTLFRFFGANGLYIYNIVAMLAANIQVLKGINLGFSPEPIALGTIVFSTTYICSDVINEHYGKSVAKQGVWYCFAAQIVMMVLMIIAIGYPPLAADNTPSAGTEHMLLAEQAISVLFTPSPRLLFASLVSFVFTQLSCIALFDYLKTKQKFLWIRSMGSTIFASVVDTSIFSLLAWKILAPNPASFHVLFFTYILWTLVTYGLVIVLSTLIIYLSYYFKSNLLNNYA